MGYRIVQTNSVTADGLEVEFRHDFADGSVVEEHFVLKSIVPDIYRVRAPEVEVGHSFAICGEVRYHVLAGSAVVEVGYRSHGPERPRSARNSAGNYIL
jgi:hypothetical protein